MILVKAGAIVLAGVIGVTGSVTGLAAVSTRSSACMGSGSVADLTAEQAGNARVIVAIGQERGVSERGLLIALMTAMQESGLRNLDHGDRDSLGLFQQRPSQGWGTPAQIQDPAYAAAAFYGGPRTLAPNPGLLDIPRWGFLPLTVAAQSVQHSATPDAYARWETPARSWLADALTPPGAGRPSACLAAPDGAGPTTGTAAAQVAIAAAAKWLGTPYSWGGGDLSGPSRGIGRGAGTVGFDCSGLTRYAWAQAGVALPRTSREQWNAPGQRIISFAALQPGDLVFFASDVQNPDTIHHVGLALGGDAMLEAPQTGDVVKIQRGVSTNGYWAPRFIGALRFPHLS